MRLIALALALSIVPCVAVVAQENSPPRVTVHKTYKLSFAPPPQGAPDPAGWKSDQIESDLVAEADADGKTLGDGKDSIIAWLLTHKVCDPAASKCGFLVHFALLDSKHEDLQSAVVCRYAFRGEDGVTAEVFFLSPSREVSAARFWVRGEDWTELTTAADKASESQFANELVGFLDFLLVRGQAQLTH